MRPGPNNLLAVATAPRKEKWEQIEVVRWAQLHTDKYPVLSMLLAVRNEDNRAGAKRAEALQMGLRAGFPDLILPVPTWYLHGLRFTGLAIEMKREGEVSRDEQIVWQNALQWAQWKVVRDVQAVDAIRELEAYARDAMIPPIVLRPSWHTVTVQRQLKRAREWKPKPPRPPK